MTPEQKQEWLQWRSEGLGASDIANAATGKYAGSYTTVAGKLGIDAEPVTKAKQDDYDRGHRLETLIADAVHLLTGYWVHGEQRQAEHPEQAHHRATLDGLLAATPGIDKLTECVAVLEIKTIRPGVPWPWHYWTTQAAWQMHVTGMPRALIAIGHVSHNDELEGITLRWIDQDPALIDELHDLADDLWGHIQAGTLPEPDAATDLAAVKRITNIITADPEGLQPVDCTDLATDLARFTKIKDAVKTVVDEQDLLSARIRTRLGQATRGTAEGYTISYSKPTNVLTAQAETDILELHPELAKTVTSLDKAKAKELGIDLGPFKEHLGHRTLRVTAKKGTK